MRGFALLLVVVLLLAGCLGENAGDAPAEDPGSPDSAAAAPPDPMVWSGSFTVAVGAGAVTGNPCDLASCDERKFTLDGTFDLEATLSWGLAANDFDLYLYKDGEEVGRADLNPPDAQETREVLVHKDLPAGDYAFLVVGSTMAMDSYTLRASFS